jgi:penicillin amidase
LVGSNSWVVHGNHTKSGSAILSNDPHLAKGVPSFWHTSHTEFPDGRFAFGHYVPGLPTPGTYTTNYISVGLTTVHVDNIDIFEEKVEGEMYWFKGEKIPLIMAPSLMTTQQLLKSLPKNSHHSFQKELFQWHGLG